MMTDTTRRTFLLGAGVTAAASMFSRAATPAASAAQAPADLQPLIARERENILSTLDSDDVPGAAVCLLYFIAAPDGSAVTYQYFPAGQGEAANFECFIGENSLDYNDGPNDSVGPNSASWDNFVGQYGIDLWGQRAQSVSVHRKNGYLYFDDRRLILEFTPGLFFTADGEAVDFRNTPPTWRSIRLQRV